MSEFWLGVIFISGVTLHRVPGAAGETPEGARDICSGEDKAHDQDLLTLQAEVCSLSLSPSAVTLKLLQKLC